MGTLHNTFLARVLAEAKNASKDLMKRLLSEKLARAGIDPSDPLVDAMYTHFQSGSDEPFHWDGDAPDIDIVFDDADFAEVDKLSERLTGEVKDAAEVEGRKSARDLQRQFKRSWRATREYELFAEDVFRSNLEDRWSVALDGLRILLQYCREMGQRYFDRFRRSKSPKNRNLRAILSMLHLRACQVVSEILALLETGFPDGAMARWRTLHEIVVVAYVINKGGDEVAERYSDHEVVEHKAALDEYTKNDKALGYAPIPDREVKLIRAKYDSALVKYGKEFGHSNGWATKLLKNPRPNFVNLEQAADFMAMRSYYKMASYNVHAGIRGLTQRIGSIGKPSHLIGGATNAGLEEPGIRAARSMATLTLLLMNDTSKLDDVVEYGILSDLVNQAEKAFARVARKLDADERPAQEPRLAYQSKRRADKRARYSP